MLQKFDKYSGALLSLGAAIVASNSTIGPLGVASGKFSKTPLRRAVNTGHTEVAALLLARGADRNAEGSKGLTPVQAARAPAMKQLLGSHSV